MMSNKMPSPIGDTAGVAVGAPIRKSARDKYMNVFMVFALS
jgi:hypothetical protein